MLSSGEFLEEEGVLAVDNGVGSRLRQGCIAGRRTEATMGQIHIRQREEWNRKPRQVITPGIEQAFGLRWESVEIAQGT